MSGDLTKEDELLGAALSAVQALSAYYKNRRLLAEPGQFTPEHEADMARVYADERPTQEPVAWATNGYGKLSLYWREGLDIDFIPNGTTIGLYTAPPQDALDAKRYRWLRDQNKHTHYGYSRNPGKTPLEKLLLAIRGDPRYFECITCEVPLAHVPEGGEPIWKDGKHFDFAANMDAAIDAAMNKEPK